jgi:uncharacterized damage-inducible protein DinB
MRIQVGLEQNNEGRELAWALDFPGCFAYGADQPEALVALVRAAVEYQDWVNSHAGKEMVNLGDFDVRLVETWEVYTINDDYDLVEGGYAVNAWFKADWKPLAVDEIEHGLKLLQWSRVDLFRVAARLSDDVLDQQRPDERWSIRGILRHVANAEYWYLDRLGLAGGARDQLPQDHIERLLAVRARLEAALPGLAGKVQVIGKEGELWSPRKLLRRVLWHEIDHRNHILKLLG